MCTCGFHGVAPDDVCVDCGLQTHHGCYAMTADAEGKMWCDMRKHQITDAVCACSVSSRTSRAI